MEAMVRVVIEDLKKTTKKNTKCFSLTQDF